MNNKLSTNDSISVYQFVMGVRVVMINHRATIHPSGEDYWTHWSSALSPEESATFTKFSQMSYAIKSLGYDLITQFDIESWNKYHKTIDKISRGKKYNSVTGHLLQKDQAESYLHLVRQAMKYCEFTA